MRFSITARLLTFIFALACSCSLMGSVAFAKDMIPGQTGSAASLSNASLSQTPVYESSDTSVVSVGTDGCMTANKAGDATITLVQGSYKKTMDITVYPLDSSKDSKPAAVTYPKVVQGTSDDATLTWKKVKRATGYVVYKKDGGVYKPVDLVEGADNVSYRLTGLEPQSTVDCVVRAYKKVTVVKEVKDKVKVKVKVKKKGKTKTVTKTKTVITKVKTKKIALGDASPYVSMLVADSNSTKANVGSITFDRKQITIIKKGTGASCAHVVSSVDGLDATDDTLRYFISDDDVASVAEDGTVTSKRKKAASCKLIVMAHNGVTAKINVNIVTELDWAKTSTSAHRGDTTAAPENTIASFYAAAAAGYEKIEFDVWETYSGDLVVMHDENLSRTYGVDMDVRDVSCDSNSDNYIGNFKATSGTNLSEYGALTIPTCEDVVRIAAAYKMRAAVHIKNPSSDPISQKGVNAIVKMLDRYGLSGSATILVQSKESLQAAVAQSEYPVHFVCNLVSGFEIRGDDYIEGMRAAGEYAAAQGCSSISFSYTSKAPFTTDLLDYLHSLGLKVTTWGVDSKKKLCYAYDVGLDGATTDKQFF